MPIHYSASDSDQAFVGRWPGQGGLSLQAAVSGRIDARRVGAAGLHGTVGGAGAQTTFKPDKVSWGVRQALLFPNSRHRRRVVPQHPRGRVDSDKPLAPMSWAQRLKRVFAIDIESCPDCGGKLRVIASIEEPGLIAKILGHVHDCRDAGGRAPKVGALRRRRSSCRAPRCGGWYRCKGTPGGYAGSAPVKLKVGGIPQGRIRSVAGLQIRKRSRGCWQAQVAGQPGSFGGRMGGH